MYNTILIYTVLLLLCIGTPSAICQLQETGTIHGQITDKQDNPLSNYTVSTVSTLSNITYAVKTNSGGQFTLRDLHAGTWDVKVYYDSTLITQREVIVTENTKHRTDFVIDGNGSISGFLLDSTDKQPIPMTNSIKVVLLNADGEPSDHIYKGEVSSGYFHIENLLPGRYKVIDAFDGFVFSQSDSPVVRVYADKHVGGVEVYLKSGASIKGQFVDSKNGQPISNVFVSVASEKSDSVYPDGEFLNDTLTDINGAFQISTPNESDNYYAFTVIASHPRYQTQRWQWEMTPNKKEYMVGELTLNPFLSLQGTVYPANSKDNVEGLVVRLKMHNRPADFFRGAAQPEHTVYTDEYGRFLFSELHPITYSLTITQNDDIIGLLESVDPQNNKSLKIRLPKLKTVRGTVVDTQQQPIAGVNLYAAHRAVNSYVQDALLSKTQTDTDGNFTMQLFNSKLARLSLEVSKKRYLARVYPNIKIEKDPLIITLHKGYAIKGRVILPKEVSSDGFYEVKIFSHNTKMEPTLNPLSLNKPLMSKRFPITEQTFLIDGLFEEQYTVYLMGDGISATSIDIQASENGEEVFIVADKLTVGIKGQLLWADTGKPIQNVVVSRSWYPWELTRYDMSLTLDRFETETDAEGMFSFTNLTQARYELNIRAIQSKFDKTSESYQRSYILKQVTIPYCSDNIQRVYIGKSDGTQFIQEQ
ncbi:carboxypeptidase regulatory-like domain-containing protein [Candidatus Poribacteria bacterium]|nr:carboxypeptidase regulatory-like domain-containing protein [Candidatus Poribacteria bacterium]